MKYLGQHIQQFISRFRNDVFLENISSGTIASGGNLGLDSNNKIVKANEATGDITGVTLTADDSNVATDNAGSADFTIAGGEGIDTSVSSTTITIAGEDASTSNKGIASFSSDNFVLSSGDVRIKSGGIDLTDEVTGTLPVSNGGTGVTSLGSLYAYQYLNWEVNTNSFTGTNYEFPAANGGFGSDSFTINSGIARNTAIDGTVTVSIANNLQQQGWFVPHACKLVAVSGAFRNNGNEPNPRDVAVFVGTPNIGAGTNSTYTQRLFAAGDDDGGTSNSKIYKVNTVLGTPFSLSAGDLILPAVCNSTGSSTISMQGNFNIIIATPIFTI